MSSRTLMCGNPDKASVSSNIKTLPVSSLYLGVDLKFHFIFVYEMRVKLIPLQTLNAEIILQTYMEMLRKRESRNSL